MTWIETFSGKRVDLLMPKASQIDLGDMSHALARINRFTGHTTGPYSVAEHSLHVLHVVLRQHPDDKMLASHAVTHDAAEHIIGDLSAPMKRALRSLAGGYSAYDGIEEHVMHAIREHLRLPEPTKEQKEIIKAAALTMLATERVVFCPNTGDNSWEQELGIQPDDFMLAELRRPVWRKAPLDEIAERFWIHVESYAGIP